MLNASLTIGADTFNRTSNDLVKSFYAKVGDPAGTSTLLTVQQGSSVINGLKTARRNVRLDLTVVDGNNVSHSAAVYLVIQHPQDSVVTDTIVKDMVVQLCTLMTATSAAATVQIINGEL